MDMSYSKYNQKAFDKVATHLLTQNAKAFKHNSDRVCVYRGANDTKCAIGCLIADEDYIPEMDKTFLKITDFITEDKYLKLKSIHELSRVHLKLLQEFQLIHDSVNVDGWYNALIELAKKTNLNFDVVIPFQKKYSHD